MAQVQGIADQYCELEQREVEVLLVARQPEAKTRALAKRFDVPIRFCIDQDGQLARKLGIEHIGGTPFFMDALGYNAPA
jgi:peroxiredoxin